jgi:hypothetical protein
MQKAIDSSRGLERRSFLGAAAAALGAATLGTRDAFAASARPETRLTFAEFVRAASPVARDLVGDTSRMGEDRYLHTLASFAVRLAEVPVPEMNQTSKGDGPRTFIGVNDTDDDCPFVVLHWRLEAGARIGLHPHIYGNVVTLGLEGEALIQNYEVAGEPDFDRKEPFQVRRIHVQILRPAEINLVPLAHGYVHGFVAGPSGARGLDITTRIKEKRRTPSLVVSEKPIDAARGLFEGTWRYDEKM